MPARDELVTGSPTDLYLPSDLPGVLTDSPTCCRVERWFGFLTDQRIRRGVHKSVQALEADIRAWIENWNANPRPFT